MLKWPWCAKKYAAHAWLRKQMLQKHPEKQLSRGGEEAQDTPDGDGEAKQEEHEQKEFVCRQCHRVLKCKTWLTSHKCEATSIINSEGSNVEEQSVTAARPICSKECHYRWLLRHMLSKHPGHDESLRPQPRAKPERKEMRTKAQSQGDGSGSLEPAGCGDVDVERPRKRPRVGRHTEEEEERDYVFQIRRRVQTVVLAALAHAHAPKHAATMQRKMKDGTVAPTPLVQRSLQCPYCPMKCALKKYLTTPLKAKRGQPRREVRHSSQKVDCKESAAHLLDCPSLRELRKKHGLGTPRGGELFFSAQLAGFLKELFKLDSPSAPNPDEPKLRPARAVKRHRSPAALDTTCSPSAAVKLIGVCAARAARKRVR
ncbi:hypothetical protein, conserved [Trypanosoma vivax Y486]|uniref:Uncharacterized protein n=1 Tax=Trypanosoma vivax (strain Y486) TaxID=1055687 RepID=F9WRT0_TRYVY|nr:hypothetical protein, conserved [Trypanosoma vivax Y486]|eukprot:CCD20264.1 hypothetical protein, conserved [Trypanosoma vivax Y486]